MTRRLVEPEGRYLEHSLALGVRFQEVDSLHVVWHGHYISYFEDARVAFGREFGVGYEDLKEAGLAAPIVRLECDYLASARFGDVLEVTSRLYERDSAKMEFYYKVMRRDTGDLLAVGRTVQVFSDIEGSLVLMMPQIMRNFYRKWSHAMVGAGD